MPVPVIGWQGEKFGRAIGGSKFMREMFGLLAKVAPTEATVLLEGETGTGKELLAEAIHQHSARSNGPYVVVDCGALPKDLIGSELFGHVRGAFTGAVSHKRGLIEDADGGTLFLDEIGELPIELQPQLLRVLEKREVRPIGELRAKKVNIRVVAATHRPLAEMVKTGAFREDLYFRLAVVRAPVPPLRKHKEDIPLLVRTFVRDLKRDEFTVSPDVLAQLMAHDWPGNVRELRNVVERGMSLEGGAIEFEVNAADVGASTGDEPAEPRPDDEGAPRHVLQGREGPPHRVVRARVPHALVEATQRQHLARGARSRHRSQLHPPAGEEVQPAGRSWVAGVARPLLVAALLFGGVAFAQSTTQAIALAVGQAKSWTPGYLPAIPTCDDLSIVKVEDAGDHFVLTGSKAGRTQCSFRSGAVAGRTTLLTITVK